MGMLGSGAHGVAMSKLGDKDGTLYSRGIEDEYARGWRDQG